MTKLNVLLLKYFLNHWFNLLLYFKVDCKFQNVNVTWENHLKLLPQVDQYIQIYTDANLWQLEYTK